jgi:hypothetical protein
MSDPVGREKWYLAVLVVASRVDDGQEQSRLTEFQYKLISAADPEAAYRRALQLGAEETHDYENDEGHRVYWEFAGLHDLHEIESEHLGDGVEVYYQMDRSDPREWVRPKEELLAVWREANKHRTAAEILGDDPA